jgi:hypothetical protein
LKKFLPAKTRTNKFASACVINTWRKNICRGGV